MRTLFTILGLSLLPMGCGGSSTLLDVPQPLPIGAEAERFLDGAVAADVVNRKGPPAAKHVIVVTLDGVRWQEVFQGVDPTLAEVANLPRASVVDGPTLLPNLYRWFFARGTVLGSPDAGAGFSPSGPRFVSLPAYLELATGSQTPCFSNDCGVEPPWTFLEEVAKLRGKKPSDVAVYASWEKIQEAAWSGPTANMRVSAGRDEGDVMPAWPGTGAYRPDLYTASKAMKHLTLELPTLLWLSLGDSDEHAHRGDYRGYLDAIRFADQALGEIVARVSEAGELDTTTIFVTTDHGRDKNFTDHGGRKSAQTWLAARGGPVGARGVVPVARARHLKDLAPTVLYTLGLSRQACVECGEVLSELFEDRASL